MSSKIALGYVCAALSGVGMAVQSGVNATLGANTGQAFASIVSFSTGLVVTFLFFAIDVGALGAAAPTAAAARAAPWWCWFGGPLGALFVVSSIIFARHIGAGSFLSVFLCAQIAAAAALDLIGAAGFPRRSFSWQRTVGVVMMGAGVALVTLFPGQPVVGGGGVGGGLGDGGGAGRAPPIGRALTHLYLRGRPPMQMASAAGGVGVDGSSASTSRAASSAQLVPIGGGRSGSIS